MPDICRTAAQLAHEARELARVYPGKGTDTPIDVPIDTPAAYSGEERRGDLAARLAAEEAKNALLADTVSDLRRRLDVATEQLGEAWQQVRALTDQRAPVRRSWWRWRRT